MELVSISKWSMVELRAIGNCISDSQFSNLIFNMRLPSSGQVTLPAAFVEKVVSQILSSYRSNGSLKRSQPDPMFTQRSGDASVIGTEEPSLQTHAKRQKQASACTPTSTLPNEFMK
ncbi:uncharacterized protein LACBIDRAFT_331414 [Laccaria bicolor S238N-H82]|uniref:Predicted protein n=1 Tax=Laccaria bicolor (strain S238N-H82 / ATCC MYA-4686) TaxID=486041 RepID=B0DPE1_LACBS|nr:uncharacterized protein LACBIDRAFT_331414 [Laccaria bicolor S238N-H82]EDR03601.1 predicted protein [Laccaria bicolor S238N-H82]|eukprot:XP_001885749.1 predicted protein [Laccaria bicolor S238N-H82]